MPSDRVNRVPTHLDLFALVFCKDLMNHEGMTKHLDSQVLRETEKLKDEFRESTFQIKAINQNALAQIERAWESLDNEDTQRAMIHLQQARNALLRPIR